MFDEYDDIKSRIKEAPTWWDVHGVPRYGEIPDNLKPFIRKIKCQYCGKVFRVCLVDNIYHTYGDVTFNYIPATYKKLTSQAGELLGDGRELDVPDLFRAVKSGEIPEHWAYGDPPDHDRPDAKPDAKRWDKTCTGVTMSSIPEWEEEF